MKIVVNYTKKFVTFIIMMSAAVYFADIIFFEDCVECSSENTDLKKDQVQPEEKNNPQSDSSTKNESEEKEEEISVIHHLSIFSVSFFLTYLLLSYLYKKSIT